jgi:hypothetical protein
VGIGRQLMRLVYCSPYQHPLRQVWSRSLGITVGGRWIDESCVGCCEILQLRPSAPSTYMVSSPLYHDFAVLQVTYTPAADQSRRYGY